MPSSHWPSQNNQGPALAYSCSRIRIFAVMGRFEERPGRLDSDIPKPDPSGDSRENVSQRC